MKISSRDFKDREMIPSEFTCDGLNISPNIEWNQVPQNVRSFALTVIDPDAPNGDFVHWVLINIPPDIRGIPKNKSIGKVIENDFGIKKYGGMCPPSGTHRYYFKVSALSKERIEGVNRYNILDKINECTIDSATITGKYSRSFRR